MWYHDIFDRVIAAPDCIISDCNYDYYGSDSDSDNVVIIASVNIIIIVRVFTTGREYGREQNRYLTS